MGAGSLLRRSITLFGAAAALTAAAAGPAAGATFTLPSSVSILDQPTVAVDGSGNAYVAWQDGGSSTYQSAVCEIPSGASSCAHFTDLPAPGAFNYGVRPHVAIDAAGTPHVIISGYNGAGATELDYASGDQGATWTASTANPIGDLPAASPGTAFDPAIGSGVLFGVGASDSQGAEIAVNGAALGTTNAPGHDATLVPSGQGISTVLGKAVAESRTPSGIALAAAWTEGIPGNPKGVGFGYYAGPPLATQPPAGVLAAVGTASNWKESTLADGGHDISLAGGPAGIYLAEAYSDASVPSVRQFTGSGFTAPKPADCGDTAHYGAGLQSQSMVQDPVTGTRPFAYIESTGEREDIRYTTLLGATQSPPVTVASTTGAQFTNPTLAVNGAQHPGLLVWAGKDSAGTYHVEATWLPSVRATGCAGATQVTRTSADGLDLSLTAPTSSACQAAPARLRVRLAAVRRRRSAPEFSRADFYVDRGFARKVRVRVKRGGHTVVKTVTVHRPNSSVRRLPANLALPLNGLKSGQHALRIVVTTKRSVRRHGHRLTLLSTRVLKTKFTVC